MLKARILLLWIVLFASPVFANNPIIQNFTKSQYKAANKNWSISEDADGRIYFGNDIGLLEFDGVDWRLYQLEKASVVRSVYAVSGDTIYSGGYEEFGQWIRQIDGSLVYTSLSSGLPQGSWQNDDIWCIIPLEDYVYFQSFSGIYRYNTLNGQVVRMSLERRFHYMMKVGDELWIQELRGALYKIEGEDFIEIPQSLVFRSNEVKAVLPCHDKWLVLTSRDGVYIYDGHQFSQLTADNRLIAAEINKAIKKKDGNYYLGTVFDGIYVLDEEGKIVRHLNSDTYLQNNTVLSLHEDNRGNVWVALDKGIACIRELPDIDCYIDNSGKLGSVYAAALFAGKLFIGTNQGLCYMDSSDLGTGQLDLDNLVQTGIKGQVWNLKVIDGKLYCAYNTGLRVIDSNLHISAPVNTRGGVFCIQPYSNYLLLGGYGSLKIVDLRDNSIVLDDVREPIINIEVDHLNNLWLEHLNKGVYRCRLSQNMDKVQSLEYYGEERHLPYKLHLFKIGGRVVFLGKNAFYTYNDINGNVELYEPLKYSLKQLEEIKSVSGIDNNHFWVMGDNVLYRVVHDGAENRIEEKLDIGYNNMSLVSHFERAIPLTESTSLICLENGFLLCNTNLSYHKEPLAAPYIKSVGACNSAGETIYMELGVKGRFPASYNNIRIGFSGNSVLSDNLSFQYELHGINGWSEVQKVNHVSYERLPEGEYTFSVRAVNRLGDVSPETSFSFRILPPWYRTVWAYLGYVIAFGLLVRLTWMLILRRLKSKHLIRMRLREARRLSRMNEQLQHTIQQKDAELFSQASFVLQRNELITRIKEEMEDFYKEHSNKMFVPLYHKINMLLNNNLDTEEDWKTFLIKFEEKHAGFFKRLKEKYPQLTTTDMKLCACLKLNLGTKEIAALMNISARSVENSRYRLRKKLELSGSENLSDFLMDI